MQMKKKSICMKIDFFERNVLR